MNVFLLKSTNYFFNYLKSNLSNVGHGAQFKVHILGCRIKKQLFSKNYLPLDLSSLIVIKCILYVFQSLKLDGVSKILVAFSNIFVEFKFLIKLTKGAMQCVEILNIEKALEYFFRISTFWMFVAKLEKDAV